MKKRAYRRTAIKDFDTSSVSERTESKQLVLAVDVAKVDMVAALTTCSGEVLTTLAWKHPAQTGELLAKLCELREQRYSIVGVMESSGSYGDVLRHQLQSAGLQVYQVSGKRVHDAKFVYDGVSSLHDAKCSAIIAKLHVDGRSTLWESKTESERGLKAAVGTMDLYQTVYLRLVHQLEGWLARHWPEVTDYLELTSATLLAVLARMGGPADVAGSPEEARQLMTGMSHRLLKAEKIEKVVQSAATTVGLRLEAEERRALMTLAREAHRALLAYKDAKRHVEKLAAGGVSEQLAPAVGKTTAAVLVTEVGNPLMFASSKSYMKAYGLTLKEKSSGKQQGRLRITKMGSGRARQYLWLAVHRWRQKDPIAQAWYDAKVKRDGGSKARAAVALMRKLVKALYHMARGEPFDSRKLFDLRKLKLAV
jgi:transposase